jgi:hypothetical protein
LEENVKSLVLGIVFVFLAGCTDHIDVDDLDFNQVESDAVLILESNDFNLAELPSSIDSLSPKNVYIADGGLYIQLSGFWVAEKGLFVPIDRSTDWSNTAEDPQFTRMTGNVYSYIIRG